MLVIVVTLAAVGASIAWIALRPPTYSATANILVTPLAQDDQTFLGLQVVREAGDPTRTVQTAATLIKSPQAAQRTAVQMGGDWTSKKVLDAITVTPEGESNILAINGKADGDKEAAKLANTFAQSALDARRASIATQAATEVERLKASEGELGADTEAKATVTQRINALEKVRIDGDPTLQFSERAQVPESPSGPPAAAIVLLAGLAGFTLGSGGALLLELTERRIRNEDEAVALYPLPVLARIPLLKSSQLRGRQASGWHMLPAVREAFRTLMIQLGPHPEGRAHVVMVTSASTGDGKTTSAVNLAAAAAASGDPVILLDFDLRKPDVGRTLGVQPGTELTGLLQPDTQLRDLLSPAPGLPALSVLTTTVAEGDVALVEALSRRLPELIADARELCNYVVIDTAPDRRDQRRPAAGGRRGQHHRRHQARKHQPRQLRDDARPARAHRLHAGGLPGHRRLHPAHECLLRVRRHEPRALPRAARAHATTARLASGTRRHRQLERPSHSHRRAGLAAQP